MVIWFHWAVVKSCLATPNPHDEAADSGLPVDGTRLASSWPGFRAVAVHPGPMIWRRTEQPVLFTALSSGRVKTSQIVEVGKLLFSFPESADPGRFRPISFCLRADSDAQGADIPRIRAI